MDVEWCTHCRCREKVTHYPIGDAWNCHKCGKTTTGIEWLRDKQAGLIPPTSYQDPVITAVVLFAFLLALAVAISMMLGVLT